MINQDEEGIDCGGSCKTDICMQFLLSCYDNIQNQDEEGIDCGGSCLRLCHPLSDADKNLDGKISLSETLIFIKEWLNSQHTSAEVGTVVVAWITR